VYFIRISGLIALLPRLPYHTSHTSFYNLTVIPVCYKYISHSRISLDASARQASSWSILWIDLSALLVAVLLYRETIPKACSYLRYVR